MQHTHKREIKRIRKISARKTGKSWLKKLTGQLHLWLGLASGLVVFVVSITGCIFAFQKEITEFTQKDKLFITPPAQTQVLPLSVLMDKAQAALGKDYPIRNATTYKEPDRAWEFMAFAQGDPHAVTFNKAVKYYRSVHLNPYTGAVTGTTNYLKEFFVIVKYLHWSLLLNTPYGPPIVGWSTLIFVILLITGLVLWWPKKWNKANRDKSFKIKWKASFKRVNYDLHNVLGFYSMLIALIFAFTGMVWAFKWFETAVYVAASGTTKAPKEISVKSIQPATPVNGNPVDIAYASAVAQLPDADRIGFTPAFGPDGALAIYGYRGKEVYYDRDNLSFDQYTGKLLNRENSKDKNRGEKLIDMNYDIHVGAIAGIPGKILAFIISLFCASLPVTGFLVWWNKRNKKTKKHKQPVAPAASNLQHAQV